MSYVCTSIHMFYLSFFSSPNFFPFLLSSLPLFLLYCIFVLPCRIVLYVYFYFPFLIFFLHFNFFPSLHQHSRLYPSADYSLFYSLVPNMRMIWSLIHLQFIFSFCKFFCTLLCRPFCIVERCPDSNLESCCSKQARY